MSSGLIILAISVIAFTAILYFLPYFLYTRYIQHSKLNISYPHNGLLISYRWIHSFIFISCALNLFAIIMIIVVLWESWPLHLSLKNILIGLLVVFGWSAMVYQSLLNILNRTTIFVDSTGEIITTYGPLIDFRVTHRAISKVRKIYFTFAIDHRAAPVERYPIWAENFLGHKILLLDRVDSESDAMTIIEAVKKCLVDQSSTCIQVDYPARID